MSKWISVKDKLPDKYGNVLIWLGPGRDPEIGAYSPAERRWYDAWGPCKGVTHWRPMIAPPQEAE